MTSNTDIINKISASGAGNASKDQIKAILTKASSVIEEELSSGEEVSITGFGKFVVTTRAAREGRNPATSETIQIAESKSVKFKPSGALKNSLV